MREYPLHFKYESKPTFSCLYRAHFAIRNNNNLFYRFPKLEAGGGPETKQFIGLALASFPVLPIVQFLIASSKSRSDRKWTVIRPGNKANLQRMHCKSSSPSMLPWFLSPRAEYKALTLDRITSHLQGRIQRLKKGGHTYRVGIGAARIGRSCLCARQPRSPAFENSSLAVRRSQ